MSALQRPLKASGFTIVELLIVVVVIGILAAITIVVYNGITQRASQATGTAHLQSLLKKVEMAAVETGSYPMTLLDVSGKKDTDDYLYVGNRYCVSTVVNSRTYSMLNNSQTLQEGPCGNVRPSYAMAPESCFAFNASIFTITNYYAFQGGDANTSNPACPKEFEVPATIGGAAVRIIAQNGFGSKNITSVVLPDGLTTITDNAFMNSLVEYVYIPNTVTIVTNGGFSGSRLKSIYIPDSVTTISGNGFSSIPTLRSVVIGSSTYTGPAVLELDSGGSFDNNPALERIRLGSIVKGFHHPFDGAVNVREFILSNGIETIAGGLPNSKLTKLVIPGTVTSISTGAFANIPTLTSLIIEEGSAELTITDASFQGTGIKTLTLPGRVKEILSASFDGVTSLTELNIKEGAGTVPLLISNGAFQNTRLTSLIIPTRVTLSSGAFAGIPTLTSLTIRNGVTSIGAAAFPNTTALTSVQIPNSVTSIGSNAFAGSGITAVSLPTGISLGSNAFTPGTTITYY